MDNVIFVISLAPQIQKEYRPQKNEEKEKKWGEKNGKKGENAKYYLTPSHSDSFVEEREFSV